MVSGVSQQVLDRLEELVSIPAVVGYEGPLLRHLAAVLTDLGMKVEHDDGAVVGMGEGGGATVVSAHADRHGLVCTDNGRFTYAAHALPSMRGLQPAPRHSFARVVCDRFGGESVRAYDALTGRTIADGQVDHTAVCMVEDLGVDVPVQGLDTVRQATPVAFQGLVRHEGRRVSAQLDNVLGVAMTLVLVEQGFDGTVVFTAEEEVGRSWRHLYRQLLRDTPAPTTLLVLDTSPFDTDEPVEAGAVVLRWQDAQARFRVPTVQRLIDAAVGRDIPVAVKDRIIQRDNAERAAAGQPPVGLGHTELGRLVRGSGGWANGATLQVPTIGYHTNMETTTEGCIDNAMAVLLPVVAFPG